MFEFSACILSLLSLPFLSPLSYFFFLVQDHCIHISLTSFCLLHHCYYLYFFLSLFLTFLSHCFSLYLSVFVCLCLNLFLFPAFTLSSTLPISSKFSFYLHFSYRILFFFFVSHLSYESRKKSSSIIGPTTKEGGGGGKGRTTKH